MFSYLFCIIDVLCIYRKCFIVFIVNDSYPNNSSLTRTYDSLRRLTTKVFTPTSNAKDANKLYTAYSYVTKDDTINDKKVKLGSLLVDTYTNKFGNKGKAVSLYKYTYDNWGNISSIIDNNNNIEEYTYDNDNQLVKATYKNNNEIISTYDYSYDNGGNILSKTINGKTIHYEYSNSFKDELTSYDGKSITYNKSGYPVSYMGDEMSFDYAGHLTSIKASGNSTLTLNNNDEVSFTYSDTGNRLSKTYNDEIVKYIYNNDLLLKEIHNNYELSFIYDYSYNITSLIYKDLNTNIETSYFFTFNNQGDVKSIYRSSDLKLIGTYNYDPYGNIISINKELIDDNDIINKNPIRYRGYYLDTETGLYYVHARYYDSLVGRWISIDDINNLAVNDDIDSFNLYAYCGNNPVNRIDSNGQFWNELRNTFEVVKSINVVLTVGITTCVTISTIHCVLDNFGEAEYKGVECEEIAFPTTDEMCSKEGALKAAKENDNYKKAGLTLEGATAEIQGHALVDKICRKAKEHNINPGGIADEVRKHTEKVNLGGDSIPYKIGFYTVKDWGPNLKY